MKLERLPRLRPRIHKPAPPAPEHCVWDVPGEECTAAPYACLTAWGGIEAGRTDTWLCQFHTVLYAEQMASVPLLYVTLAPKRSTGPTAACAPKSKGNA